MQTATTNAKLEIRHPIIRSNVQAVWSVS